MVIEQNFGRKAIRKILPYGRRFMFLNDASVTAPDNLESLPKREQQITVSGTIADFTKWRFRYLRDHFKKEQIDPGVIITEALAQLSGLGIAVAVSNATGSALELAVNNEGKVGKFRRNKMDFLQEVYPEDQLALEAVVFPIGGDFYKSKVRAMKDSEIAAEGELTIFLGEKNTRQKPPTLVRKFLNNIKKNRGAN